MVEGEGEQGDKHLFVSEQKVCSLLTVNSLTLSDIMLTDSPKDKIMSIKVATEEILISAGGCYQQWGGDIRKSGQEIETRDTQVLLTYKFPHSFHIFSIVIEVKTYVAH